MGHGLPERPVGGLGGLRSAFTSFTAISVLLEPVQAAWDLRHVHTCARVGVRVHMCWWLKCPLYPMQI